MSEEFDRDRPHLTVAVIGEEISGKSEIVRTLWHKSCQRGSHLKVGDVPVYEARTENRHLSIFDVPDLRANPSAFAKCIGMADLCLVVLEPLQGLTEEVCEQIISARQLDVPKFTFASIESGSVDEKLLNEFDSKIYDFTEDHYIDNDLYIMRASTSDVTDVLSNLNDFTAAQECRNVNLPFRMDVLDGQTQDSEKRRFFGKVKSGTITISQDVEFQVGDQPVVARISKAEIFEQSLYETVAGDFVAFTLAGNPQIADFTGSVMARPGLIPRGKCFGIDIFIASEEEINEQVQLESGAELAMCFSFGLETAKLILPDEFEGLKNGDNTHVSMEFPEPTPVQPDDRFFIWRNGKVIGVGMVSRVIF